MPVWRHGDLRVVAVRLRFRREPRGRWTGRAIGIPVQLSGPPHNPLAYPATTRLLIARQHFLFATQAQATGESGRVSNLSKWMEEG
jgi:hypothetical protein